MTHKAENLSKIPETFAPNEEHSIRKIGDQTGETTL
jgi:hypothetical protein